MTYRITLSMLRGACKEQRAIFKAEWPKGADATIENVRRAQQLGLDLTWGYKWFIAPAQAAYNEAIAPAWAAYHEALATAWAAYHEATAPAWAAYKEALAPATAAYKEALAPAWAAYHEATAPARAAYHEATAPAWLSAFNQSMAEKGART